MPRPLPTHAIACRSQSRTEEWRVRTRLWPCDADYRKPGPSRVPVPSRRHLGLRLLPHAPALGALEDRVPGVRAGQLCRKLHTRRHRASEQLARERRRGQAHAVLQVRVHELERDGLAGAVGPRQAPGVDAHGVGGPDEVVHGADDGRGKSRGGRHEGPVLEHALGQPRDGPEELVPHLGRRAEARGQGAHPPLQGRAGQGGHVRVV
mmetsp:Transcript_20845/g.69963  ORF Transcript_20845/g.69963 Transcript_20845/m.69963 type:complete len:207 (+) Transcript_20845:110-730(+)